MLVSNYVVAVQFWSLVLNKITSLVSSFLAKLNYGYWLIFEFQVVFLSLEFLKKYFIILLSLNN